MAKRLANKYIDKGDGTSRLCIFTRAQMDRWVEFIVDTDMVPLLSEHTWYESHTGIARAAIKGRNIALSLQRFVAEQYRDGSIMVRHKNRNTRDNRIDNLEIKKTKPKRVFKTVREVNGCFEARVKHNNKPYSLGMFDTSEEAKAKVAEVMKDLDGWVEEQKEKRRRKRMKSSVKMRNHPGKKGGSGLGWEARLNDEYLGCFWTKEAGLAAVAEAIAKLKAEEND